MNAWKYEIISRVEQETHCFTFLTREIPWSTLEIDFIFPTSMYYSLFNVRDWTVNYHISISTIFPICKALHLKICNNNLLP